MNKKIIVDILMLILMLLEFSRGYLDPIYHEIFGILLFLLFVLHLVFNRNYFKTLFHGKYSLLRIITIVTNSLFMITFLISILFGVLSSTSLFSFFNIGNITIIQLHKMISYFSLIFLGIHLGIHFQGLFGKISNKISNKLILYLVDIVIIIFGIYSFISLDVLKHLTGEFGFSVYNGNIILNILKYFSIILMISIMTKYLVFRRKKDG